MPRNPTTAVRHALDAAQQLDGYGIVPDTDATKWLTKLQELRDNPPQEPAANTVAALIADSASPTAIDKAITAKLGANYRTGQHGMACQIVAGRVLDCILDDRGRIHDELASHADAIIKRLHQAAALTESIIELTKSRRVEEAHLLAVAESDVADLQQLLAIRDNYITPLDMRWSTGWWTCAEFSNPWAIEHPIVEGGSRWDLWRANIRAGGKLWFPTIEQATAASQPHEPVGVTAPIDPRRTGATFAI